MTDFYPTKLLEKAKFTDPACNDGIRLKKRNSSTKLEWLASMKELLQSMLITIDFNNKYKND